MALVARSGTSGDGGGTEDKTIFYNPEQPMLLKVFDNLGDHDIAGAQQSMVLKIIAGGS